jgi:adenosylcobinamide kinase/adenosylcobinamide-phosphate guanylyltransferase
VAIVLIGGGARSGKSAFALGRARQCGTRLAYLATAQALDDEMRQRVAAHQRERGDAFITIEEPFEIARVIAGSKFDCVVVDCLTLWISNLMLAGREPELSALTEAARHACGDVVFVGNEVGCGIVPENELARRFRDIAGRVNQAIAACADEVYWMAFGCPLRVK